MKIILRRMALLSFLFLVPILSCKAAKTLDEEWPGYHCYFLAADTGAATYNPVFTYREYEGLNTTNDGSVNPNPACLDSSYQGRTPVIGANSCEANLYPLFADESDGVCDYHGCGDYYYPDWQATITSTNQYSSYPKDCMAISVIAGAALGGNTIRGQLFIESGKNSDFYDEDEINYIKNNIYSSFDDDTNFCFARKYDRQDSDLMFYFGKPYKIVDYEQDMDEGNVILGDGMVSFDYLDYTTYTVFPEAYSKKTVEELSDEDFLTNDAFVGYSYIVVDATGNMITDSNTCLGVTKEWLDTTYNENAGYDIDVDVMADQVYTDSTDENEERDRDTIDYEVLLRSGYSIDSALKMCSYNSGNSSNNISDNKYHCYKYTHAQTVGSLPYNTTIWTDKSLSCNFELTNWDYLECKNAKLNHTTKQCTSSSKEHKPCYKITNSGYDGVASFRVFGSKVEEQIECNRFIGLHYVYRIITIAAPILAVMFITFDFFRSIMSGDEKKVSQFKSKSIRRIIALILLITIPIFISILVNVLSKNDAIKDTSILKIVAKGCD